LQHENGDTVAASTIQKNDFVQFIGAEESSQDLLQPMLEVTSIAPEHSFDTDKSNGRIIDAMGIGLCCCFVLIVVVVVTILVVRKRK